MICLCSAAPGMAAKRREWTARHDSLDGNIHAWHQVRTFASLLLRLHVFFCATLRLLLTTLHSFTWCYALQRCCRSPLAYCSCPNSTHMSPWVVHSASIRDTNTSSMQNTCACAHTHSHTHTHTHTCMCDMISIRELPNSHDRTDSRNYCMLAHMTILRCYAGSTLASTATRLSSGGHGAEGGQNTRSGVGATSQGTLGLVARG